MKKPESQFYELGPFKLDTSESCLIHGSEVVPLTPKLFGLLMAFVQSKGGTVSKDDLAKAVWQDTIVTDAALAKNISRLKKILRDGEEADRRFCPKEIEKRFKPRVLHKSDKAGSVIKTKAGLLRVFSTHPNNRGRPLID